MAAQLQVTVGPGEVRVGERFRVSFQRTLRIPENGQTYPLPPGFGPFPVHRVEDYSSRVPPAWRKLGGVFIPMYQREALWLAFGGADWKPNAVKVGIGRINVVSGEPWIEKLRDDPQDYVVCPNQPWLDGINVGDASIRQFVAAPLGSDLTVEAQLTGSDRYGGMQILVIEPKPHRFPDQPPSRHSRGSETLDTHSEIQVGEMGIGAGGKIKQKIYPDPYGVESWDQDNHGFVHVHVVNSEQYQELTGHEAPPTPISISVYNAYSFPWFDLYDEGIGDVEASETLVKLKAVGGEVSERGDTTRKGEVSQDADRLHIKKLRPRRSESDE